MRAVVAAVLHRAEALHYNNAALANPCWCRSDITYDETIPPVDGPTRLVQVTVSTALGSARTAADATSRRYDLSAST